MMKQGGIVSTLLILLVLIAVIVLCVEEEEAVAAGVIDVTESNHEQVLDGSIPTLVEFFAPWCGHCKRLAPEYERLGQTFADMSKQVQIARVDCTKHNSVCTKYSIRGYPTLKWIQNKDTPAEDYSRGRSAEDMAKFINEKINSNVAPTKPVTSSVVELTPANFDEIVLNPDKTVLVAFYAPWCGHCKSSAPTYDKLSVVFNNDQNVVIGRADASTHSVLREKYGIEGYPTVKIFPKGSDKTPIEYDQDRSLDQIVAFVNQHAGTHRTTSGLLSDQAGVVDTLSDYVKQFVESATDKRDAIVSQVEKAIGSLSEDKKTYSAHYVKSMKKIIEKGEEYVEQELQRLDGLIQSAKQVAGERVDEFKTRSNILKLFKK
jgi:protein disulfide-isomerase A6